jgi:hypothetical protein
VGVSCKQDNEPSGSIKCSEVLQSLHNWQVEEDVMGGACSTNGEDECI